MTRDKILCRSDNVNMYCPRLERQLYMKTLSGSTPTYPTCVVASGSPATDCTVQSFFKKNFSKI